MKLFLIVTAAAMVSIVFSVSAVQAERTWFLQPGTVICPTPFNMREALSAADRGDIQWLQETGCQRLSARSQIVIVEDPPLSDSRPWRVRIFDIGQTAYVHSSFVMGYATVNGKRIGPLSYYEVYRTESNPPAKPISSRPLTASEINNVRQQLLRCWNIPAGASDAKDLVVTIRSSIAPDGRVLQADIVDKARMSDPSFRATAESARRAFFHPLCTPLHLPPEKYEAWKTFEIELSPKDIPG
jgi:hypothetical protein